MNEWIRLEMCKRELKFIAFCNSKERFNKKIEKFQHFINREKENRWIIEISTETTNRRIEPNNCQRKSDYTNILRE
jgi:hypothetical protein